MRVLWRDSGPLAHHLNSSSCLHSWSKLGLGSRVLTDIPCVEGSHSVLCEQAAPYSSKLYFPPCRMRAKAAGSSWHRVPECGGSCAAPSPAVTELSSSYSLVNLALSTSQADLKRASLPALKFQPSTYLLKTRFKKYLTDHFSPHLVWAALNQFNL